MPRDVRAAKVYSIVWCTRPLVGTIFPQPHPAMHAETWASIECEDRLRASTRWISTTCAQRLSMMETNRDGVERPNKWVVILRLLLCPHAITVGAPGTFSPQK